MGSQIRSSWTAATVETSKFACSGEQHERERQGQHQGSLGPHSSTAVCSALLLLEPWSQQPAQLTATARASSRSNLTTCLFATFHRTVAAWPGW